MSKQKTQDGVLLHFDVGRHCSSKPKEKRELIYELHLHKAIWKQRWAMALSLIRGKPIHLVMGGVDIRVGDRRIAEIEL